MSEQKAKAQEWLENLPTHPDYIRGRICYPPHGMRDIAKLLEAYALSRESSELSTLRTALARAEEQNREKDKEIERLKTERDDLQAAFNKGFETHRAAKESR